ncbi:HNH endonuclease signature motif containing protein [soil metagenome]
MFESTFGTGTGTGTGAGPCAGADGGLHMGVGAGTRGEALRGAVGNAGQALGDANDVVGEPGLIGQDDLVASLEGLVGLRALAEPVTLALVAEAIERGLPGEVGLSARDWLGVRCPWLSRPEISDLVTVAEGIADSRHAQIAEVARAGGVPLRRLAKLLRSLGRIAPVCTSQAYEASVAVLLPVVADPGFTDKDLKIATDHLLECALPDKDKAAATAAATACREIHESSLGDGSLTRFVMTCDAPGAALIRAIMASPLAAPAPDDDTGPDERTAKQRKYDAVMTVLERGMTSPEGTPTTSKAKIFVTMSYDMLRDDLVGAGRTFTGETLTAAQVRQMACSAELIPTVLGSESEVVDHGRASRLATPAQIKRLWLRDKGCTFPGCSIPATWCDAHHVTWWSRHGQTDLSNLALLCGRHHTRVHDLDLTATITTTGVTWHV